jgi:thioredoxin-related protein
MRWIKPKESARKWKSRHSGNARLPNNKKSESMNPRSWFKKCKPTIPHFAKGGLGGIWKNLASVSNPPCIPFIPTGCFFKKGGIFLVLLLLVGSIGAALAIEPSTENTAPIPQGIEVPRWFANSFLDFREDVADAAKTKRRLLIYFGQQGCPYCRELVQVNFSQKDIVETTRRHFQAIAIDMWDDRETVWLDGKRRSEKELAAYLKVNFTPTLLFLDEQGKVVLRLNGYYPPHKFRVALDYVAKHMENTVSFSDYLRKAAPTPDTGLLHDEPFFTSSPYALQRNKTPAKKPLAVFFEQPHCAACDEMHMDALKEPETRKLIEKFEVVRLNLFGKQPVLTPDEWARALKLAYTPSIVFFDEHGKEVFRVEAYLKAFHLQSSLDYVASRAYLTQPSFQRFVKARGDALREKGVEIDLWK